MCLVRCSMITNENDFLGMLIKNMNEKHEVHHSKAMKLSGLDDEFYRDLCVSLKDKGYIYTDSECVTLRLSGIRHYESVPKVIKKSVFRSAVFTVKIFFEILVGIIIAVTAAFLVYHFGWQ